MYIERNSVEFTLSLVSFNVPVVLGYAKEELKHGSMADEVCIHGGG